MRNERQKVVAGEISLFLVENCADQMIVVPAEQAFSIGPFLHLKTFLDRVHVALEGTSRTFAATTTADSRVIK